MTVCLCILRNSGMYFTYGFGYLTVKPTYLCREGDLFSQCDAATICNSDTLEWKYDTAASGYIENWAQQMSLTCVSEAKVGLMITAYFVSYAVGGLLLFPLPDRWGRRKTFALFGGLSILGQFLILLVPNYTARLCGYCLMGVSGIKNSACYVWLFDLVQTKHKSIVCGLINSFDCLTLFVVCFYFKYISVNWFPLFFAVTALSAVAFVVAVALSPETPKWLLLKNNQEGAIKSFNKIAAINGAEALPEDSQFAEIAVVQNPDMNHTFTMESGSNISYLGVI